MYELMNQGEITPQAIIAAYLLPLKPNTRKNYQRGIKRWLGFLMQGELSGQATYQSFCEIETSHVRLWCAQMQLEGLAGGTIAVYLAGLTGLYNLIVERGDMRHNPFKSPLVVLPRGSKAPRRPTEDMGVEGARALLSTGKRGTRRDYAMLCVLLGGGLRLGELLALSREDVVYQGGITVLRLYDTKGGGRQDQSLPPWAARGLRDFLEGEEGGGFLPLFDISRMTVHRWFKELCGQAGLEAARYSVHSCRTTAINELIRQGIPLRDIRQFSRHKNVATVERYERRVSGPENNPGLELIY